MSYKVVLVCLVCSFFKSGKLTIVMNYCESHDNDFSIQNGFSSIVSPIKCYQCSSDEDPDGEDNCGAYEHFDQDKNIAVDCMGEEATTPGLQ